MVKKVGKQFSLSFITTDGDSYSRKLNGKKKADDDSFGNSFHTSEAKARH